MSKFNLKNNPVVISKDTMNRLIKDVKEIIQHPLSDNSIYYSHDEENMLKGYAMIIGPSDTPYFGGYYFFELNFPVNYPYSPPHIIYCTNAEKIRFNPNLYVNGKVCLSLLNTWKGEQWTSCQTISSILLTICTILIKNPLLNEPGIKRDHHDFEKYNKIIQYKNIDIAILQILQKKIGVFLDQFKVFDSEIKDNFKKNAIKIRDYLEEKKSTESESILLTTGLYNMNVKIDWNELYEKFMISYNMEMNDNGDEQMIEKNTDTDTHTQEKNTVKNNNNIKN
jgi:ubiquitin-conjugating enzyme E2 Z